MNKFGHRAKRGAYGRNAWYLRWLELLLCGISFCFLACDTRHYEPAKPSPDSQGPQDESSNNDDGDGSNSPDDSVDESEDEESEVSSDNSPGKDSPKGSDDDGQDEASEASASESPREIRPDEPDASGRLELHQEDEMVDAADSILNQADRGRALSRR